MPSQHVRGLALPAFAISCAVLCQELLLVRLLAFGMWNHITTMVVTSALLAFGFAGTLLAVVPRLGGRPGTDGRGFLALFCHGFAIASFGSAYAMAHAPVDTVDVFTDTTTFVDLFTGPGSELFVLYLLVGLPIMFGGLAIAVALRNAGAGVARTYFANLVGSSAGCVAFLLLLTPLGGPTLFLATAAFGSLAGMIAGGSRRWSLAAGIIVLLLTGAGALFDDVREHLVPPTHPVPSKVMTDYLAQGHVIETTVWDTLCRVDVTGDPAKPRGRKIVFQDGDAPTFLEAEGFPPSYETQVPYIINPGLDSLLIIGSGGGRELALAASKGVGRAVGVEINAATCSLLFGPYRDFTGNLVQRPGVEVINDEGRAFLARTDETFDYIQMTGVDTYAALNSGAYVNSESYLYTAEAFDAFLDHLKPGGAFSIMRYFFLDQPRETLRLFVMALDAVKRQGAEDPTRHVMVLGPFGQWGLLVVSRDGFTEETVQRVRTQIGSLEPHAGVLPRVVHDPLGEAEPSAFTLYAEAFRKGDGQLLIDGYALNVAPVTDDSPYLYLYWRWMDIFERLLGTAEPRPPSPLNPGMANMGQIPTAAMVTLSLVVQSVVVGILLVLGPLLLFRLRALRVPGAFRSATYFSSLGLGFMLLEIALAQKFGLFLGHPSLSLAVVIGGMLFFSGLGAWMSGLFQPRRAMVVACTAAGALGLVLVLALPHITETWLAEPTLNRIALALGVIAPLAFIMGMPMPSGLRVLSERSADFVPWAFGVNGVASVLGSVLAILLAGSIGFTWVMVIASGLYGVAALCRVGGSTPT